MPAAARPSRHTSVSVLGPFSRSKHAVRRQSRLRYAVGTPEWRRAARASTFVPLPCGGAESATSRGWQRVTRGWHPTCCYGPRMNRPRRVVRLIMLSMLALALLSAHAHSQETSSDQKSTAGSPAGQVAAVKIACPSKPGTRNECRADTSAGVILVRSTGDAPCLLGRTWATTRRASGSPTAAPPSSSRAPALRRSRPSLARRVTFPTWASCCSTATRVRSISGSSVTRGT